MRPPADLHIHSNHSDGTCSVGEICALVVKSRVRVFALSDHDTTDGLAPIRKSVEAQNRVEPRICLIPSIELSSGDNGLAHVLGYGIREGGEPLESELASLRRKRVERIRETIALLNRRIGTDIPPDALEQDAEPDYTVGRMHVARLLIEKRIVRSIDETFQKYLGVGKPAYIPLKHIATEDAVGVLRRSGAVPVLAHPARIGIGEDELEGMIARLKDRGLTGLEVYHPSASRSFVKRMYRLAQKYALLVTGGSDFHGDRSMRTKIGEYPSGWHTWEQDIDTLQAAVAASDAS